MNNQDYYIAKQMYMENKLSLRKISNFLYKNANIYLERKRNKFAVLR